MSTSINTLSMTAGRLLVRSLKPHERFSEAGLVRVTEAGDQRPCHGIVHAVGDDVPFKVGQEVLFAKFTGEKIVEEPGPGEPIFSVHQASEILGVISRIGDDDD